MARSSLWDVRSIGDPAQSWNFDLFLPTIPGSSDARDLTFKCKTTDLPGFGLETLDVALHGVSIPYAGRAVYTHSLNATFLETRDWSTRDKFWKWRELARSWKNNSGSYYSTYAVDGVELVVYDDLPQVVRTIKVWGFWPETIAEVNLDGSASSEVLQTITFKYAFTEDL